MGLLRPRVAALTDAPAFPQPDGGSARAGPRVIREQPRPAPALMAIPASVGPAGLGPLVRERRRLRSRAEQLARSTAHLEGLTWGAVTRSVDEALGFLELDLGPLAAAEEQVLQPAAATRLGRPGLVEGCLNAHRQILYLAAQLAELRVSDVTGNQFRTRMEAGFQTLWAQLRAHLDTEDADLAALEAQLTPVEADQLVLRVEAALHQRTKAVLKARREAPSGHGATPYRP